MIKTQFLIFFTLLGLMSFGQNEVVNIWPNKVPNSQKSSEKEIHIDKGIDWIEKVKNPTLTVFLPPKRSANGKAVVICPGGGYRGLAYDWEGTEMAKWFNTKGIAAFVLKYRLPEAASVKVSYKAPLQDAQRAMRIVRNHAEKWNVKTNQIGVIGSSAGGHLASTLGTHYEYKNEFEEDDIDRLSARPDFMVLVYPVVTMKDDFTHKGSKKNLLGKKPSEKLIEKFSNELHVNAKTPPTFIVHSADDKAVPVENSLQFYTALKNAGVYTEMHLYPTGGHGYSLAIGRGHLSSWPERLADWLESLVKENK